MSITKTCFYSRLYGISIFFKNNLLIYFFQLFWLHWINKKLFDTGKNLRTLQNHQELQISFLQIIFSLKLVQWKMLLGRIWPSKSSSVFIIFLFLLRKKMKKIWPELTNMRLVVQRGNHYTMEATSWNVPIFLLTKYILYCYSK